MAGRRRGRRPCRRRRRPTTRLRSIPGARAQSLAERRPGSSPSAVREVDRDFPRERCPQGDGGNRRDRRHRDQRSKQRVLPRQKQACEAGNWNAAFMVFAATTLPLSSRPGRTNVARLCGDVPACGVVGGAEALGVIESLQGSHAARVLHWSSTRTTCHAASFSTTRCATLSPTSGCACSAWTRRRGTY